MIDAQRSKLATPHEDDHQSIQRHCCCSPSPWLLMSCVALRGRCCAFCYIEQKEVEDQERDSGIGAAILPKMDQQRLQWPQQRLANCSRQVFEATTKLAHRLTSSISVAEPAATLSRKRCSLLVSIVLPLLLVLLLPSQIRLEHSSSSNSAEQLSKALSVDKLLLSLLRFPFDRLRFVSGLTPVAAKEINSKHDLQEEETHLQMKAPTSERSGYHLSQSQMTNYQQQQQQQQPLRQTQRQQQAALEQQQAGYGNTQVVNQVVQPQQEQPMAPHQSEGHYGGSDYATGNGVAQGEGANLESALNESGATTADQSLSSSGGGSGSGTALVGPSSGLQTRADLPAVRALNVKCEKNHMTVNIVFDRPFYGMVFSKGHYNDQKCVHLPANSGQTSANFDIHLGKCGMSSSDASGAAQGTQLQASNSAASGNNGGQQPNGLYIENVIIIQYDPQVQEIYDQARKLRCTWYDYYEKSVTFRPYNVDMLDAVTANFLGDNIQCWMQIQVGKGPWSSEVAGIVKIGQTMTMVLAIKDDENRFDMLVRNCVAHDGKHQPIQLVDEYGCVARPKIMAKFQKVRNFGPAATVVSYAHFQAFKFPDSMSVHFQCVIQVCRYECPEPVCSGNGAQQSAGADLPGIGGGGSSSGNAGNGGGASDYAASGTEIVASKEPLPNGLGEQSAVNLKLDESQGRVQVKLDTSMMAGIGSQVRASSLASQQQSGPLPPHLLHLGAAEPLLSNSGGNSRSPISIGNAIGRGGNIFHSSSSSSSSGAGVAFQRSATPAPPGGAGASNVGRPAMVNRAQPAAPSGLSQTHYSAPFPAQQQQQQQHLYRNVYTATNRVGELALSELELDASRSTDSSLHINPISGSPRALRLAPSTTTTAPSSTTSSNLTVTTQQRRSPPAPNHRYRRALRSLPDFTDVQTQKTIQVVSPDDVAFSLLSDDLEPPTVSGSSARQRAVAAEHLASTVCFSATRLMAGLLIALAALAASVAVVATLLLRQRWQRNLLEANNKLYELDTDHLSVAQSSGDLSPTTSLSGGAQMATQRAAGSFNQHHLTNAVASTHLHHDHHRQQQQKQQRLLLSRRLEDEAIMSRRQQDELQHRNNYLARLYSQFVPATYWR